MKNWKNWMIMLFLLFAPSGFAELTPEDILTISGIVEKSENRMRAYIIDILPKLKHGDSSVPTAW